MELRQLKYFLAVADARSFVSAANSLYISRQAISKAIAQLEEELKVDLFMRNSNGAFLTPAGILFYDRVRSIVIELNEIRTEMQRYGSRYQQRIRLAFSVGITPLYEQRLLQFQSSQANVVVEYQEYPEEQCITLLAEHQTEVAVCTKIPSGTQFVAEELYRSQYGVLLCNREGVSELERLELSDLKWLPLAGIADSQNQEFCARHNLHLQFRGYDYQRLIRLARMERCALLMPECLVPMDDSLCWLPLERTEWWQIYQVHLQQLENNILYRTALDELQYNVLYDAEGLEDSP